MSRPVRGRSFKITKNQARGYGYAKARSMKPNPGVTTIAAINGRGAYAGRSARSVMSRHRPNARPAVARKRLTAAQKAAFKARMSRGRMAANRTPSSSQRQSSRSNIKKAQRARKAWGRKLPRGKRVRVGGASYGSKPKARRLKAGVYIANRRKKAGSKTMARRRKKPVGLKKKRRSSKRRRTTTKSAAPRRKRRRTARKGKARRKTARKTTRRRARRSTKLKANRRRRHRRNPAKRRRSRKATAAAPKRRRRKSRRKGSARRTTRKRRSSKRRRSPRRLKANRRRRSHRRNPRRALAKNRRRSKSRRKSHRKNRSRKSGRRRSHRRNGRRLFKMNGVGDVIKVGAVLFGGFALHRVLSNLIGSKLIPMLTPAPAAAATSGVDSASLTGLAVNLGTAALTGFAVSKMVKNPETKKLILGGIVMSVAQTLITSLLQKFAPPSFADALSGPEDGTAARLSAMYGMRGLGAGASIMPRYAAIGEYFREPMSGLGEYFREPMNGVGEYIAATSGIGTYEPNADLYQAAAGMGNHDYQGNHIDPSGDLDRQLTIAEAAAGVGALSPFEAAAGIGPMQAAAGMRGFGAIDTVPSGDTWIPGSTNPQLWAGVKAVSAGQSASEMTPAGILQTDGGSGIFG